MCTPPTRPARPRCQPPIPVPQRAAGPPRRPPPPQPPHIAATATAAAARHSSPRRTRPTPQPPSPQQSPRTPDATTAHPRRRNRRRRLTAPHLVPDCPPGLSPSPPPRPHPRAPPTPASPSPGSPPPVPPPPGPSPPLARCRGKKGESRTSKRQRAPSRGRGGTLRGRTRRWRLSATSCADPPPTLPGGHEVPLGQEAPAVVAKGCLSDCLETAHDFTWL